MAKADNARQETRLFNLLTALVPGAVKPEMDLVPQRAVSAVWDKEQMK